MDWKLNLEWPSYTICNLEHDCRKEQCAYAPNFVGVVQPSSQQEHSETASHVANLVLLRSSLAHVLNYTYFYKVTLRYLDKYIF